MILSHQIAARVLGIDTTSSAWSHLSERPADWGVIAAFGGIDRKIEYAARARAVERWPLRLEDRDGDAAPEWEPNDGGTDGVAPAAVRHICAGALVASLVTGMGFSYGDQPWLPIVAGPIRPLDAEGDVSRTSGRPPTHEPIPEEATQATRGRSGVAKAVCEALLGVGVPRPVYVPSHDGGNRWEGLGLAHGWYSPEQIARLIELWGGDPESDAADAVPWLRALRPEDRTPDEVHEAAIDLAIDLLADERHHVAEIVAGAAAWLLARYTRGGGPSAWATARVRRMCAVVGVMFPLANR